MVRLCITATETVSRALRVARSYGYATASCFSAPMANFEERWSMPAFSNTGKGVMQTCGLTADKT